MFKVNNLLNFIQAVDLEDISCDFEHQFQCGYEPDENYLWSRIQGYKYNLPQYDHTTGTEEGMSMLVHLII